MGPEACQPAVGKRLVRLEGEERLDAARRPRSRRRARRPGMRGGLCAHARGVAGGGRGQQGQGERPTHCRGTACQPLAAVVAGRAAAQQQQNHLHSLLDLTRESSLVKTSPRACCSSTTTCSTGGYRGASTRRRCRTRASCRTTSPFASSAGGKKAVAPPAGSRSMPPATESKS